MSIHRCVFVCLCVLCARVSKRICAGGFGPTHPSPATGQQSHSERSGGSDVEAGNVGMGPASLLQTLEEMQAMGLEHTLAGEQAARHAQACVAEQGGGHQE